MWSCETHRTNITHFIFTIILFLCACVSLVTHFSVTFSLSFDKNSFEIQQKNFTNKPHFFGTFLLFLVNNGLMIYRINVIQLFFSLLRHIKQFWSRYNTAQNVEFGCCCYCCLIFFCAACHENWTTIKRTKIKINFV